jgi:DNA-binding MarR family transcriptional regulator
MSELAPRPEYASEQGDLASAYRLQLAVTRLARLLRQEVQVTLTPSQVSALSTIRARGPITLGDLAERERVAPPSITRMVSRLEEEGYVERSTDPADGRVCRVAVTAAAEEMISEARKRKADWLLQRMEDLAGADRRALLDAVEAMETLAELR